MAYTNAFSLENLLGVRGEHIHSPKNKKQNSLPLEAIPNPMELQLQVAELDTQTYLMETLQSRKFLDDSHQRWVDMRETQNPRKNSKQGGGWGRDVS